MDDPYKEGPSIRADLWNTMNTTELEAQRALLLSKLALLSTMMANPQQAPPGLINMYGALQTGLADVTTLISKKISSV